MEYVFVLSTPVSVLCFGSALAIVRHLQEREKSEPMVYADDAARNGWKYELLRWADLNPERPQELLISERMYRLFVTRCEVRR
jgi:hypothetical protein